MTRRCWVLILAGAHCGCGGRVVDRDTPSVVDDGGSSSAGDAGRDAAYVATSTVDHAKLGGPCDENLCRPSRGQCIDYSQVDPTLAEPQCVKAYACWPVTCATGTQCIDHDTYVVCR